MENGDSHTPLPKERFNTIFDQGRKAAAKGRDRIPPYNDPRNRLPWYTGYDSYEKQWPTEF